MFGEPERVGCTSYNSTSWKIIVILLCTTDPLAQLSLQAFLPELGPGM